MPEALSLMLQQRLEQFPLDDPPASMPFSARLSRENGWSAEFTQRVIAEYRRFLFLCAQAGHPVTPSDEVDQAWHLHLCYTESYWVDLCEGVLGFPLHHGPTKGGRKERQKYRHWYARTLESYRRLLQQDPPEDIWPPPSIRFGNQDFRRIDAANHFILSKRMVKLFAGAAASLVFLVGCTAKWSDVDSSQFGWIFVGLLILMVVIGVMKKGGGGKGGSSG